MSNELINPTDGENQAVRAFLRVYSGTPGLTFGLMKRNLEMSGYPHWPEWVNEVGDSQHLNKLGAQNWLRHLFSLEPVAAQPQPQPQPQQAKPHGLVEALRFYADTATYRTNGHAQIDADLTPIKQDRGERARAALRVAELEDSETQQPAEHPMIAALKAQLWAQVNICNEQTLRVAELERLLAGKLLADENDSLCPDCGQRQRVTPSGLVCDNGHGY